MSSHGISSEILVMIKYMSYSKLLLPHFTATSATMTARIPVCPELNTSKTWSSFLMKSECQWRTLGELRALQEHHKQQLESSSSVCDPPAASALRTAAELAQQLQAWTAHQPHSWQHLHADSKTSSQMAGSFGLCPTSSPEGLGVPDTASCNSSSRASEVCSLLGFAARS